MPGANGSARWRQRFTFCSHLAATRSDDQGVTEIASAVELPKAKVSHYVSGSPSTIWRP